MMTDVARKISIQFTRPVGWYKILSHIIRWISGTPYSHARLFWLGAGGNIKVVYEASGSHIKFMGPISQKDNPVKVIEEFEILIDRKEYRKLVELCMTYANVQYGRMQLIGMGLVRIFELAKNPFANGRKSQVCTEVIGYFLEDILKWNTGLDYEVAGLKELCEFLKIRTIKKDAKNG